MEREAKLISQRSESEQNPSLLYATILHARSATENGLTDRMTSIGLAAWVREPFSANALDIAAEPR
jgi:hypothetical protein